MQSEEKRYIQTANKEHSQETGIRKEICIVNAACGQHKAWSGIIFPAVYVCMFCVCVCGISIMVNIGHSSQGIKTPKLHVKARDQ